MLADTSNTRIKKKFSSWINLNPLIRSMITPLPCPRWYVNKNSSFDFFNSNQKSIFFKIKILYTPAIPYIRLVHWLNWWILFKTSSYLQFLPDFDVENLPDFFDTTVLVILLQMSLNGSELLVLECAVREQTVVAVYLKIQVVQGSLKDRCW